MWLSNCNISLEDSISTKISLMLYFKFVKTDLIFSQNEAKCMTMHESKYLIKSYGMQLVKQYYLELYTIPLKKSIFHKTIFLLQYFLPYLLLSFLSCFTSETALYPTVWISYNLSTYFHIGPWSIFRFFFHCKQCFK